MKIVVLTPDELQSLLVQSSLMAIEEYLKRNPAQPTQKAEDRLLTRFEASERLHCDPATVSNLIKRGRLKSEKIERRVYIRESELNERLKAGGVQ